MGPLRSGEAAWRLPQAGHSGMHWVTGGQGPTRRRRRNKLENVHKKSVTDGMEGASWNLRSEGYEMGLAKGRAVQRLARSGPGVGHFRVGRRCRRPFQENAKSRWKVCTFCRFTRYLLLIVLLSVLRMFWVESSMLLWKNCFNNIQEVTVI